MQQQPKGPHNWGRWGDDDERGALNLLTPEVVQAAAGSITTGRVYPLGIPIQNEGVPVFPFRGTPMRLTLQDSTDYGSHPAGDVAEGTGSHQDYLVMPSHTTSHMDALVHVYSEFQHYNGVSYREMHAMTGAHRLGIEKVDGFAARGVLLDLVAYYDDAPDWVAHDRVITGADLQGAADAQGVDVRPGDVALIRTGYINYFWAGQPEPRPRGQAGIGVDGAQWLADHDVVAVAADNAAVEAIPFDGDPLVVHKKLLVDHGIYILEFLDLAAPARDRAYEGLITIAPLKITGATGCPVNPVFIT